MNQSSVNSLESMLATAAPLVIFFFIFGTVAFIVSIAYVIRLWFVQTATFQMRDDLADIKNHLLNNGTDGYVSELPQRVEGGHVEPLAVKKEVEFKRPGKLFVWMAIAIPVLLICFVVVLNIF